MNKFFYITFFAFFPFCINGMECYAKIELTNKTGALLTLLRKQIEIQLKDHESVQLSLDPAQGKDIFFEVGSNKYHLNSSNRAMLEILNGDKTVKSVYLQAETAQEALDMLLEITKDKLDLRHRK